MKIIADDKIPFLRGVLESRVDSIRYMPGGRIDAEAVADADALLIRTRTRCDRSLLGNSSVRWIATATIGTDHIDAVWCDANGVFWTAAPGCNSASVAQYVASALVNLESDHKITLRGRTLGVIGVGNVGTKVARVGKAFGMRVLLNDPPRARKEGCADFVTLEHLLEQSDVVTLHVPLEMTGEDATYHLADDRFFSRMREGAVILNSSRGEVVDPGALERAIRSGSITASVIDVWENEPDIDPTLLNLVTYATPHIAGYSLDGKANGTSMIVQALSRRFGLGLDEWHPESLPVPPNGVIVLDTMEPNASRAVATAVNTSYDIRNDDRRLRADPASFEKQRGDYPLRREFPAFSVRMKTTADTGDSKVISDTLKGLGFRML